MNLKILRLFKLFSQLHSFNKTNKLHFSQKNNKIIHINWKPSSNNHLQFHNNSKPKSVCLNMKILIQVSWFGNNKLLKDEPRFKSDKKRKFSNLLTNNCSTFFWDILKLFPNQMTLCFSSFSRIIITLFVLLVSP